MYPMMKVVDEKVFGIPLWRRLIFYAKTALLALEPHHTVGLVSPVLDATDASPDIDAERMLVYVVIALFRGIRHPTIGD